ncbi:hypothetical protein IFM89_030152 [Coptis chinensis]|uniref:Uncharacterized protein n=1 Tax=Coptis chinensis TaxID=261450 RepID=A0A835LF00_9MAGN|nr:hypothetical protein IFM89_030152 [Coptis chinensis]
MALFNVLLAIQLTLVIMSMSTVDSHNQVWPPVSAPVPSHIHVSPPPPSHNHHHVSPPPPSHNHYHVSPPPPSHNHHVSPPPPSHIHPPAPAPSPMNVHHHPHTRSPIAVQGVVYCKSCKYVKYDTIWGATPLSGAVVKLQCNNSKKPTIVKAKTDKNGYFFLQARKEVTTYRSSHKCRVFLVSSPLSSCNTPTNFNGGLTGAFLKYEKQQDPTHFSLFTVGPLAFAPNKCPK